MEQNETSPFIGACLEEQIKENTTTTSFHSDLYTVKRGSCTYM